MTVKVYKPKNHIVRPFIESIYILTREEGEAPTEYLTFPSIFTIVTASEKTKTVEKNNKISIEYCVSGNIETNLACNFVSPVHVQYKGKINEITIYFKPLGINQFLDRDLNFYSHGNFPDFNPFEDYKDSMIKILACRSYDDRIKSIENYWASKLRGFRSNMLQSLIKEMLGEDKTQKPISGLALKFDTSRTTINKLFKRHICKTPTQFRKIIRFRRAMDEYLMGDRRGKLTDITYSIDYFDQSHMAKDFKKLTGRNPKSFFSKISEIERGQITWLII